MNKGIRGETSPFNLVSSVNSPVDRWKGEGGRVEGEVEGLLPPVIHTYTMICTKGGRMEGEILNSRWIGHHAADGRPDRSSLRWMPFREWF
jgi:hypothetical protein